MNLKADYDISFSSSETTIFLSMVQGAADKTEYRVLELNQDRPGTSDQRETRYPLMEMDTVVYK